MSNVVQFLEALAQNPKQLSANDFLAVVAKADLTPSEQSAILERNVGDLNHLLGGRMTMVCAIVPAENDEPLDDENPDDGESPEDETSSRAA